MLSESLKYTQQKRHEIFVTFLLYIHSLKIKPGAQPFPACVQTPLNVPLQMQVLRTTAFCRYQNQQCIDAGIPPRSATGKEINW